MSDKLGVLRLAYATRKSCECCWNVSVTTHHGRYHLLFETYENLNYLTVSGKLLEHDSGSGGFGNFSKILSHTLSMHEIPRFREKIFFLRD